MKCNYCKSDHPEYDICEAYKNKLKELKANQFTDTSEELENYRSLGSYEEIKETIYKSIELIKEYKDIISAIEFHPCFTGGCDHSTSSDSHLCYMELIRIPNLIGEMRK